MCAPTFVLAMFVSYLVDLSNIESGITKKGLVVNCTAISLFQPAPSF